MKGSFLERRGDVLALGAGVFLTLLIIAAYVYGVSSAATSLETAVNPDKAAAAPPVYDLEGASRLDLKGLSPGR